MFDVINAHPNLAFDPRPAGSHLTRTRNTDLCHFFVAKPESTTRRVLPIANVAGHGYRERLHLLSLTVAIGMAVYGQSPARQIGADLRELRDRMRDHIRRYTSHDDLRARSTLTLPTLSRTEPAASRTSGAEV